MLKSEIKESLLLLIFAFLLRDILTAVTVGFVVLETILVWLKIRPSKFIRNAFALGLFISYWLTYGKVIDPETGLNFLTSIVALKLLEKETRRDQYMIFFGLVLLISSGSLFEKTLTYVGFFSIGLFVLIQDFYKTLGLPSKIKNFRGLALWVFPLTVLLFFLTPRLMNPLPYQTQAPSPDEVGYTPDVNVSEIENLSGNDRPVFQVEVSRPIPQENLYWRGNTLSFTDGWNWTLMPHDRPVVAPELYSRKKMSLSGIEQRIRVFQKEDFFFSLDLPSEIYAGNFLFRLHGMRTLNQKRWQWFNHYEVISIPHEHFENSEYTERYLRSSLSEIDKEWIRKHFIGNTLSEIKKELRRYFYQNGFSYSLSPGRVKQFREFITIKKIGLCAHYASAMALILRVKGIPARLVSGFMGGTFNRYANSYLVTQNDAHVWVEALENNHWVRFDPTTLIAPDRLALGGEAFMNKVANNGSVFMPFFVSNFGWVKDVKQWLAQWDFKFYQLMEEMDYYGQDAFLDRLHFKRRWLYTVVPFFVLVFAGLYIWYISKKKKTSDHSEFDELWHLFHERVQKKGLTLSYVSIKEIEKELNDSGHPEKEKIQKVCRELIVLSFGNTNANLKEMRRSISQL